MVLIIDDDEIPPNTLDARGAIAWKSMGAMCNNSVIWDRAGFKWRGIEERGYVISDYTIDSTITMDARSWGIHAEFTDAGDLIVTKPGGMTKRGFCEIVGTYIKNYFHEI